MKRGGTGRGGDIVPNDVEVDPRWIGAGLDMLTSGTREK